MDKLDLKIRPARAEDLGRIAEIESDCFPPEEAASLQTFKERFNIFGDSFFVGEADGMTAAFIDGAVTDSPVIYDEMYHDGSLHKADGLYQAIFGLCTHPDFQRKGIAEAMMRHLIQVARSRGKRGLILTCKEQLTHYYEKFGFVNQGVSDSVHGGAVWYDMRLEF